MMDALHAAREAMEWAEDGDLNDDAELWFFAKAQAYAAIAAAEAAERQAAALERIAGALYAPDVAGVKRSITDNLDSIATAVANQWG